jgi:hypothetical protein
LLVTGNCLLFHDSGRVTREFELCSLLAGKGKSEL